MPAARPLHARCAHFCRTCHPSLPRHCSLFLCVLCCWLKGNDQALAVFKRMQDTPMFQAPRQAPGAPLITTILVKHVQAVMSPELALIAEVGDSW